MQHKKAYFWGLLNQLLPTFVSLVTTMLLARLLSPKDYGTIGVLAVFFSIANTLIDSGLSGSLINEVNISRKDYSTISVFNLLVGCVVYCSMFFIAPWLERFYSIDGLCTITRLVSIVFLIYPLGLTPIALLSRRIDFKSQFKVNIISNVLSSCLAVILAYCNFGVYALVWMQLSSATFKVFLSWFYAKYNPSFVFSINSFKRLFPFGVFTTLSSVFDSLYENLLLSLSGKFINVHTTGYIRQAKNAEEMMGTAIARTISNVSFPILSRYKTDANLFFKEAWRIFSCFLLFGVPLLSIASVYAKWIIIIVYGQQWLYAAHYLSVLLIAGIFMVMETLVRCFIKSYGKAYELFKITIIKRSIGIIILIFVAFLRPYLLVEAYMVCSFISFIVNLICYSTISNVNIMVLLYRTLLLLLPSALYLFVIFLFILFKGYSNVFIAIVTLLFVIIYYMVLFHKYGITALYIKKKLLNQ